MFSQINLAAAKGLSEVEHLGPSTIGTDTLVLSRGQIPEVFLRGCGLSDWEVEAAKLYSPDLSEAQIIDIQQRVFDLRKGRPLQFYSVFISHSSANKDFARLLEAELQSQGIRCWLDEKQILPGDDIHDAIDRGVKHFDKVILCCSREALEKSWWVEVEIKKALSKEQEIRKEGRKVSALVPLALDRYVFDEWDNGLKSVVTDRKVGDFTKWREGTPLPPHPARPAHPSPPARRRRTRATASVAPVDFATSILKNGQSQELIEYDAPGSVRALPLLFLGE